MYALKWEGNVEDLESSLKPINRHALSCGDVTKKPKK